MHQIFFKAPLKLKHVTYFQNTKNNFWKHLIDVEYFSDVISFLWSLLFFTPHQSICIFLLIFLLFFFYLLILLWKIRFLILSFFYFFLILLFLRTLLFFTPHQSICIFFLISRLFFRIFQTVVSKN